MFCSGARIIRQRRVREYRTGADMKAARALSAGRWKRGNNFCAEAVFCISANRTASRGCGYGARAAGAAGVHPRARGKQDKTFRPRPETAYIPVRGGEKAKQDKTTRPGVADIPVRREKRTGNGGTIKTADRMENTVRRRVSASADKESGPPVSDFHSGSAPGAVIEPLFSLR